MAYLQRAHADNVRHVELFFDPQGHTERGVPFATALDGIWRALDDAKRAFQMSSNIIMCFLRHLDEASAFETLEQAMPYRDRITGVGGEAAVTRSGFIEQIFERAPGDRVTLSIDRSSQRWHTLGGRLSCERWRRAKSPRGVSLFAQHNQRYVGLA